MHCALHSAAFWNIGLLPGVILRSKPEVHFHLAGRVRPRRQNIPDGTTSFRKYFLAEKRYLQSDVELDKNSVRLQLVNLLARQNGQGHIHRLERSVAVT